MSTQPVYGTETYREKARRKFKQQPLVPIGALATTAALVIAMTKMRKGQSKSFNNWLRVRIVAQGFTIGAIVIGSWTLGTGRMSQTHVQESAAAAQEKAEVESAKFKARLAEAEESHRVEDALKAGRVPPPAEVKMPEQATRSGSSWWRGPEKEGSDKPS